MAIDVAGKRGAGKRAVAAAVVTVLITLVALVVALKLWKRDLAIPFRYTGDSLPNQAWIQAMLEDGWWWTCQRLGAPFQMDTWDFPQFPHLHFVILKALALGGFDAATLMNLYFLLSFPLIALAALAALRSLRLSYGCCVCGGVLYAFLPYHFWRGVSHLWLAAYFMVPLVGLVIIWLFQDRPFMLTRKADGRLGLDLRNPRGPVAFLICVAIGFDFPYYPVFAGVLFFLAGALAYGAGGSGVTLLRTAVLVALTAGSFLVDISPHLAYRYAHGPNPSPRHETKHPWQDGESFGLTVTQMLLPPEGHRLPALKAVRDKFYAGTPIWSSGDAMSLGAVGAVGLLLTLGAAVFCGRSAKPRARLCHLLGMLTILAILLCTVGGFCTLFNLLGTGLAREYSRMTIFIAFLALAVAFTALDSLRARFCAHGVRRLIGRGLPAGLLALGLLDQTATTYLQDQQYVKAENDDETDFVARVEAAVPAGTMVFQLPYISLWSCPPFLQHMVNVDHLRPFFHSRHLRWSFGAMHGRETDRLHAHIAAQPVPETLRMLAVLGFGGVYVDRLGYADRGGHLEADLRRLLDTEPIVSHNQRMAFYDLRPYAQHLRASSSDSEWSRQEQQVRHTVCLEWGAGFFPEERDPERTWHWCGPKGELYLDNITGERLTVALEFEYRAYDATPARLDLGGPVVSARLDVRDGWSKFQRVLEVPPGRHVISLECTAKPFQHPTRTIVFVLSNVRMSPLLPGPGGSEPVHHITAVESSAH
jgi:phosphoglycerol transferase